MAKAKAFVTPKAVKKPGAGANSPVAPKNSNKISERAMLVSLTVRRWHPHATDRSISDEVAANHQVNKDMGKYRKRLLPKVTFKALSTIINEIRNLHYYRTLPWTDGSRILSSVGYMDYMKEVAVLRARFDAEWKAFLPHYPALKSEAKLMLGTAYNETDYPSIDSIATKFGVDISVAPIPSGNDFRVELGDEEVARIRKEIELQAKLTVEAAMKEVWGRLQDVVQKAAERLKLYKDDGDKVEHTFRESLITNIGDLLDIIPSINIANDPKLTEFAALVRAELTVHTVKVLKDDAALRAAVTQKADDILARMAEFLS